MPNLTDLSHFSLKIIFTIHTVLSFLTWSTQGRCPQSVIFYNMLFFVCILWAVYNMESDEPLQFALFINVLSVFFDVVILVVNYDSFYTFSLAFMIINLVARPVTSIYLLRIGQGRNGTLATIFAPSPSMGLCRQDYEEISHLIPQNADFDRV
ncbi:PREDICTED: uncharacterized protein LOC106743165 [Dinoponera quadriceps]|uniref:Uncharacterized protein LOC106743165 n=1 Tax=Dinoponera quadriceps TaxID=609295 RepID=A0A6P3X1L6_DINQU|nr:PREDICTED: uncharacterized protein LOC106743165 [Dinoponera quadriceps]